MSLLGGISLCHLLLSCPGALPPLHSAPAVCGSGSGSDADRALPLPPVSAASLRLGGTGRRGRDHGPSVGVDRQDSSGCVLGRLGPGRWSKASGGANALRDPLGSLADLEDVVCPLGRLLLTESPLLGIEDKSSRLRL